MFDQGAFAMSPACCSTILSAIRQHLRLRFWKRHARHHLHVAHLLGLRTVVSSRPLSSISMPQIRCR
jgi:hypothetical protein